MLISDSYRALNAEMHRTQHYGHSGAKFAPEIRQLAEAMGTKDILDYGCGLRTVQDALGYEIQNYDPALPEFAGTPERADLVVCTEVLEHIEPDCLDDVLDDLARLTRKCMFATIAHFPAVKFLPDGRNAHLIQQDLKWWLPRIWKRFTLFNFANDGGKRSIIVAGPLGMSQKQQIAQE